MFLLSSSFFLRLSLHARLDECHQDELTLSPFAEQIKRLQRNGNVEHEFSVFWVPRRTLVSNSILEDAGIIGDVNIADFPLYFMPVEQDVLSLELETSFSDLYLVSMQMVDMTLSFVNSCSTKILVAFSMLQRPL